MILLGGFLQYGSSYIRRLRVVLAMERGLKQDM